MTLSSRLSLIALALAGPSAVACGSEATPAGGSGGQMAAGGSSMGATGGTSVGGQGATGGTVAQAGTGGDPFAAISGTDPGRNRVPGGQVCQRIATIQCAGEAACCESPGRSVDQCISAQVTACQDAFIDTITSNAATGYDIDLAETALAGFEQRASQCDPTIAAWTITTGGLRGVMRGSIGPNGNCTPLNPTDRAMAAVSLASCQNPDTTACLPEGLTGLQWDCAPRSGDGGPCLTDLNCNDGLYCDNFVDPPALTGATCVTRKQTGAGCQHGQECASLTCRGGSCVDATKETAYCLAQQ
jgi:hypothetical protein